MQLLVDQGWTNYYNCNTCSRNGPVAHWNNPLYPDYDIRIRVRRGTFTLWSKNMQIHGPDWLYKLEAILKQFNIYAETTQKTS